MSEPYELETGPVAPPLPGSVVVRPSLDDAVAAAAADVMMQAHACVRGFGDFHLAMPAGEAAHHLILRLMTDPNYRGLPWSRTHVWATRERRIGPGDAGHWLAEVGEMLLHGSDLPSEQIHGIHGHLHDADARYERELCAALGEREPGHDRLDCVVLPATETAVRAHEDPMGRLVGPTEDGDGVGLTGRAIRGSRLVMVVGTGVGAKPVLDRFGTDADAVGVVPDGGLLRWYLDRAALGHENLE